jgi:hypothetical protein
MADFWPKHVELMTESEIHLINMLPLQNALKFGSLKKKKKTKV